MGLRNLDNEAIKDRVFMVLIEKHIDIKSFIKKLDISEQRWNNWMQRGIPADWHYTFASELGVFMEWLVANEGYKYKSEICGVHEKPAIYDFNVKTEEEQCALIYLRTMLLHQRKEWLAEGKTLSDLAQKIRAEVKKEDHLP